MELVVHTNGLHGPHVKSDRYPKYEARERTGPGEFSASREMDAGNTSRYTWHET